MSTTFVLLMSGDSLSKYHRYCKFVHNVVSVDKRTEIAATSNAKRAVQVSATSVASAYPDHRRTLKVFATVNARST